MGITGQLQDLPRRKRGKEEEPTELQQEITRELEQELNQSRRRRQCELRRDAAQLTVLRELQSWVACHASETKGSGRGGTDTENSSLPCMRLPMFFLKESDMCDGLQ